MRERLTAFINWVRETWAGMSRRARIIFLGVSAAVLLLALVLTLILNYKEYVVLFNDLDDTENAQVIAVLNDNVIPYEVDNGRLMVEDRYENRARLLLASFGFEDVGFSYDIQNGGGLTATQQDKNRREIQGLQNRLKATIELYPEISQAIVTIAVPERAMFAVREDETPVSASVTITRRPNGELSPEQVRGIVNIVVASVPGLLEENLSIVDNEMGDLKSVLDLTEDYNNRKLTLTEEVSNSMRAKIVEVVQPVYGQNNVRIAVVATLNTDSRIQEQNTYQPLDPDNPTNNPLDYVETDRQKTGDGFAAAGGVPGAQDNVGTPQYAAQEAEAQDSAYYSSHDIYDYLVSSLREQITKDGFVIEKASASIIINAEQLREGERDSIIALAANASNIPAENITVQNIPFHVEDVTVPIIEQDLTRMFIISGIGLLALAIILVIVLTALARRRRRLAAAAAETAEGVEYDENGVPLIDLMGQEEDFEPIALQESAEQRLKLQIKDLAESDPEIVAQLIKTWLVSSR